MKIFYQAQNWIYIYYKTDCIEYKKKYLGLMLKIIETKLIFKICSYNHFLNMSLTNKKYTPKTISFYVMFYNLCTGTAVII